jgi:hypothetical protein
MPSLLAGPWVLIPNSRMAQWLNTLRAFTRFGCFNCKTVPFDSAKHDKVLRSHLRFCQAR